MLLNFAAEDLSAHRKYTSSFYFHTVTVQIASQSCGFSGNQNILINYLSTWFCNIQLTSVALKMDEVTSNINCTLRNDIRKRATSSHHGLLRIARSPPKNCFEEESNERVPTTSVSHSECFLVH